MSYNVHGEDCSCCQSYLNHSCLIFFQFQQHSVRMQHPVASIIAFQCWLPWLKLEISSRFWYDSYNFCDGTIFMGPNAFRKRSAHEPIRLPACPWNYFPTISMYVMTIHQRYRQMDGQNIWQQYSATQQHAANSIIIECWSWAFVHHFWCFCIGLYRIFSSYSIRSQ